MLDSLISSDSEILKVKLESEQDLQKSPSAVYVREIFSPHKAANSFTGAE